MLFAFDSAARTGSFTAAAKELNLTQGAISRQIAALENQLDVILFTRTKKNDTAKRYRQGLCPGNSRRTAAHTECIAKRDDEPTKRYSQPGDFAYLRHTLVDAQDTAIPGTASRDNH